MFRTMPKVGGPVKSQTVGVSVNPKERMLWEQAAAAAFMTLSEWLRHLARVECERLGIFPKRSEHGGHYPDPVGTLAET